MAEQNIVIKGLDKTNDKFWVAIDSKGTRFLVPNKEIRPHLELGKVINAEVELDVQKKDKSGTYNLIQSITVNGQVIGGKIQRGFVPSRARSPEERQSIEAQVAYKGFIELCVANKFEVNDPVMMATIAWGLAKLGGKIETKAPQEVKGSEDSPAKKPGEGTTERDKTITRIREYAIALGWLKPGHKELGDYIVENFKKKGIHDLTDKEIDKLEGSLHSMLYIEDIPF